MQRYALVTGAGSAGIGRAISLKLNKEGYNVICVGRRKEKLEETKSLAPFPGAITVVVADVSTEQGRNEIAQAVQQLCEGKPRLKYLIHNAGIVGPLKKSTQVKLDEFRQVMGTNLEGPIFLSQSLFPYLEKKASSEDQGARVLHISSGVAHVPSAHWLCYSVSKAALLMAYRCLNVEFSPLGVFVGSLKPGIVESEMQEEMRRASSEDFPQVKYFQNLKDKHDEWKSSSVSVTQQPHTAERTRLDSPENVAFFTWWLLTKTSDLDFSSKDWDIREETKWLE